jgi:hypothetical protein
MSDNNLNDLLQRLKHSISGDAYLGDSAELILCEELADKIKQLQKENADLNTLLDSCYNDICRPYGKISKSTAQVLYIRECSKILTSNKEE